jgi:hypothetical protein
MVFAGVNVSVSKGRSVTSLAAIVLALFVVLETEARAAKPKLTGVVWTDTDRDGVHDQAEAGHAGVRVELLFSNKRTAKPAIVRSAETDATGAWKLRSGAAGFYRARVLLPGSVEGFTTINLGSDDTVDSDVVRSGPELGMTPMVKLRRGKRSRAFDAGLLPIPTPNPDPGPDPAPDPPTTDPPNEVATIGEFVWRDVDADGIQDPAEVGVGGVTVEVWNAEKTTRLATTQTNSAGFWALPATVGTTFRVRVVTPDLISPANQGGDDTRDSDINATGPDAGFSDVYAASASTTDIDVGIYIAVEGMAWTDTNANGTREAGEPALSGVSIQLWNAPKTQLFSSATTGADGSYRFVLPAPGSYRVRALPGALTFSPKDNAGDDAIDSDINPTGANAGFTDPLTLNSGLTGAVDVGLH